MEYTPLTTWILEHGIPQQTLELFITITILATIVSISRYIFGTKTYGIYVPIILAISYSYTGFKYGLAITLVVIITTLFSYSILKRIRMHYITRIAINYCLLSIVLVIFLLFIDKYGLGLGNMSQIPSLAVISIAALSDFFIKQFVQKSIRTSIALLLNTLVIASFGWFVITRDPVTAYTINNLWIIPLLIIINLTIGQFKGLRIKDLFRFNSILQDKENVSK
ncbi:MAG: 7TM domain-containing protein [Candidatus Dojkabacteria bacterium]